MTNRCSTSLAKTTICHLYLFEDGLNEQRLQVLVGFSASCLLRKLIDATPEKEKRVSYNMLLYIITKNISRYNVITYCYNVNVKRCVEHLCLVFWFR